MVNGPAIGPEPVTGHRRISISARMSGNFLIGMPFGELPAASRDFAAESRYGAR